MINFKIENFFDFERSVGPIFGHFKPSNIRKMLFTKSKLDFRFSNQLEYQYI